MKKKKLPKWATTVTPFSKFLALSMLIIFPILGFYFGIYYQKSGEFLNNNNKIVYLNPTMIPQPTMNPLQPDPSIDIPVMNANPIPFSWKTYTSNLYHFSIRYPDTWDYSEMDKGTNIQFEAPPDKGSPYENNPSVALTIDYKNPNINSLDEDIGTYSLISLKKVRIGNYNVAEIHHTSCPDNQDCINVDFVANSAIYSFNSNFEDKRYIYLPIIYQMISTYKPF